MIAYNQAWLDALIAKENARKWHLKGLISDEKWKAVQEGNISNFRSHNVFVRIGLGLFCFVLLVAAMGLAAMIFIPDSDTGFALFSIFWGIVWIVLLELWSIQSSRHHGSGIDDMLLYFGAGSIIFGSCSLLNYSQPMLVYYCLALPFLVAGSIRYLDRLMALASFLCALFIVLSLVKDIPRLALYLLPFAGMLFSAGAYFFARHGQRQYAWRHWHGQLMLVELLALATFYASGNYWVIQQAGVEFFQLEQVPIAWFFWLFTFLVPAAYIYWGLRRKDRHLLDIGIGCIAAAVFTFRYYFHVMSLAWASVIGGAILFATAYFSIQYLRKNEGTYTYAEDSDTSILQEIEEQFIEQGIANQPGATPDKKDSFGGGQFGGGGASGEF